MIRTRRKQVIQFHVASDIFAILVGFGLSFWLRFISKFMGAPKGVPHFTDYLKVLPILLLIQLIYFSSQGFYKIKLRRNRLDDLFGVIVNCSVSAFITILLFSYLRSYQFVAFEISHTFMFTYIPLAVFLIFTLRLLVFYFFKRLFLKRNGLSRVLIAGEGDLARLTADNLSKYRHFGIEITGFLHGNSTSESLGSYEDLERIVNEKGITDLFIALPLIEYGTIMRLIKVANNLLVDIRLVPDILQLASLKAGMEHIEGLPIINLGDIPLQGWRLVFKRIFDFSFSLIGLILLLPLFVFFGLLIKLDSRGSVFYRQKRIGLDGAHFNIIKFRTMVENAEKETGAIWSPPNDKRVTSVGRFLRKFSIDELPQLINVLLGEMSLVGPRPERPELVRKFINDIPRYMLRHRVRAGISGWAQVHGLRGNTPLSERIEFDIYYIQNWSIKLDLEILWRTILKLKFIDRWS